MRENKFQSQFVQRLRRSGAVVFNVHGHAMQAPGWPDLQIYHWRWHGHVELKCGQNDLSEAQRIRIAELTKRCVSACVITLSDDEQTAVIEAAHCGRGYSRSFMWQSGGDADDVFEQLTAMSLFLGLRY